MQKKSVMVNVLAAVALFFCAANAAYAQCGAGIPSGGNPQCLPPDALYKNQGITQPQSTMPAQQPIVIRQKWADRWGAISVDGMAGSMGFVTGYSTKALAENASVKECKQGGGRNCSKPFAFQNQCAAFAVGERSGNAASAADENSAEQVAIKKCERENKDCWIYKAGCSHAEAVPIR